MDELEQKCKIFVQGIRPRLHNEQIADAFKKFGPIRDMVRRDNWALIRFEKAEGAAKALCSDDVKIDDVLLVVKRAV